MFLYVMLNTVLRRSVPKTFIKPSFAAISMRHKSVTDSIKDTVKGASNLNPNNVNPTNVGGTINAPETKSTSSTTVNTAQDGNESQSKDSSTQGDSKSESDVVGKNMQGQKQELPGQGEIESERALREGGTPPNADQILK